MPFNKNATEVAVPYGKGSLVWVNHVLAGNENWSLDKNSMNKLILFEINDVLHESVLIPPFYNIQVGINW